MHWEKKKNKPMTSHVKSCSEAGEEAWPRSDRCGGGGGVVAAAVSILGGERSSVTEERPAF